jgi:hypothetical protein
MSKINIFKETESYDVAQAGLEFTILLSVPPNAGITDVCHHTQQEASSDI